MKSVHLTIAFIFLLYELAWSATITSVNDGNWTTNSVWSCNCQPTSNDNIVIPSGRTVTATGIVPLLLGPLINITIGGTLILDNATLSVDGSDVVNILSGGKITGAGILGGSVVSGITPIVISSGSSINGPASITNGVLPIKLIYFKNETVDDGILLKWASAEENNLDYYEISRSDDGKVFVAIEKIPGRDEHGAEYIFLDTSPSSITNYYKLTAVDIGGAREEMPVIKCQWSDRHERMSVYPNPFSGGTLQTRIFGGGTGSLRLLNCHGLVIAENLIVNVFSSDFELPATLPPGIYFMSAEIDGTTSRVKLIIN